MENPENQKKIFSIFCEQSEQPPKYKDTVDLANLNENIISRFLGECQVIPKWKLWKNLLPPKRKKALAIHSTFPTFRKYARRVSLLHLLKYIIGILPPTLRPRSSTSTASCGRDHITDIITCHMDNFITIHTFRFFSIERRLLNALSYSNYFSSSPKMRL